MTPKQKADTQTETSQTIIRLPKDKHKQLKLIALHEETSLNDLLNEAVDIVLEKHSDSAEVTMKTGAVKHTKK